MHAGRVAAEREELVRADQLRDDERAALGPPQRDLAPARHIDHRHDGERAVRDLGGQAQVRDAQPRRDRGAVAAVAVEQLQHGRGAPERGDALERPGTSTGSTSQTRPPVSSACEVRVNDSGNQEKPKAKLSYMATR